VSNNPPGLPRNNALTRAMDMVQHYNQTYVPRSQGGAGVPDTEFVAKPQEVPLQPTAPMPQQPMISPEEAQRRLMAWAGETGQMLDPNSGNVVGRMAPQPAPYATNPGVMRPVQYAQPQVQYRQEVAPMPYYGPAQQVAPPPRMSLSPMSGIQAIQSIDFDRNVVWADGTPFPFDPREAQPVLQFALEVILRHFSVQFGALLQRYGLVQPVPSNVPGANVPQGRQQAQGNQELLPPVSRGDATTLPVAGTLPVQVPVADAPGTTDGSGNSSSAT